MEPMVTTLDQLKQQVLDLGHLVIQQVDRSIEALVQRNSPLAREVIQKEREVDQRDLTLEEACVYLLESGHLEAADLRFVVTAVKIATDLERIGDLAENIAERAIELNEEPQLKPYIDIPRMAQWAQRMVEEALEAFVSRDASLARKVCEDDDYIDDLTKQIFRELVAYMVEDPHTINRAIRISFISKYLERIADHATNVAEMVVYMVEGRLFRHHSSL